MMIDECKINDQLFQQITWMIIHDQKVLETNVHNQKKNSDGLNRYADYTNFISKWENN